MKRHRAIPRDYMTVGELAKKMGTTVRTLQYYDRIGLFAPSAQSEGGRRLYTHRDLVRLHQILCFKQLGFSLDDIKERLICLDTPEDVARALAEQAAALRGQVEALSEALRQTELLRAEVLQMRTVDFPRYADILVNLQMKNEAYWLVKHFDDELLDGLRGRFQRDSGLAFLERFRRLTGDILRLREDGVPPDSPEGRRAAKAFWDLVGEFTGGDRTLLPKLMELGRARGGDREEARRQALVNGYLELALDAYFSGLGIDPLGEEAET